jgi:hypothetical protein
MSLAKKSLIFSKAISLLRSMSPHRRDLVDQEGGNMSTISLFAAYIFSSLPMEEIVFVHVDAGFDGV